MNCFFLLLWNNQSKVSSKPGLGSIDLEMPSSRATNEVLAPVAKGFLGGLGKVICPSASEVFMGPLGPKPEERPGQAKLEDRQGSAPRTALRLFILPKKDGKYQPLDSVFSVNLGCSDYLLCVLGQMYLPLRASVFSFVILELTNACFPLLL